MIIRKDTDELAVTVYKAEGYGKKEHQVELLTIIVPPQVLVYDLTEQEFEDRPLVVKVNFPINACVIGKLGLTEFKNDKPIVAEGLWSIGTFELVVSGCHEVTDTMARYIRSNLAFVGEAKITEDTHVWSRFRREEVAGGIFKKSDVQLVQFVMFELFGVQTGFFQWRADMLDPLIDLRDRLVSQREQFKKEISVIQLSAPA